MPRPTVTLPRLNLQEIVRFCSYVDRRAPNVCWPWVGGVFHTGYGSFWIRGKNRIATRVMYLLRYGVDPYDLDVLHHCDNPICVNWADLFLGTQAENNQDKIQKGRSNTATGKRHGSQTHPENVPRGDDHWTRR